MPLGRPFVCECGDEGCTRTFATGAYELARSRAEKKLGYTRRHINIRHPDCMWVDTEGFNIIVEQTNEYKTVTDIFINQKEKK